MTSALCAFLMLVASVASAQDKLDAAARAKAIAPWIDEQTIAVVHVDLSRVNIDALVDQVAPLKLFSPDELNAAKMLAGTFHKSLSNAGVKDGYIFLSLADGVYRPRLFGVIPLDAGRDDKVIRLLLVMFSVERRGDALLVAGDRNVIERLVAMTPDQRPELAAAVEAAGDTAAQLFLLPPKHYRRVIEESVGELRKDIGGGSVKIVTRGALWATVGVELPPHPAATITIQSEDAQAAQALHDKIVEMFALAAKDAAARRDVPKIDEAISLLTPKVDGSRLRIVLDEKNQGVDSLIKALADPIGLVHRRGAMAQSANNLKQIALGMLVYEDRNRHLPPPAIRDKGGKPLLSWRVAILPHIGQNELFKEFHVDEPWDSPHNRPLVEKMPAIYRLPGAKNTEPGRTNYVLPVDNGAAFTEDKPTTIADVTDGTSNTIMIVEADDDHAVIWTKPDDLPFDPQTPARGLGTLYNGGFYAAYCDGHVSLVPGSIDAKKLKALFTRAGGEVIDQP